MEGVGRSFVTSFGNYLLHGIEEVHLPEPVSWWPQTPGWNLLGLLLLLALSYRIYLGGKVWWRNRYRRQALRQLALLGRRTNEWQQVVCQLPFLLKATALQAFPRSDVARLSGSHWLAFLDAHYPGPAFSGGLGQQLLIIAYQPEARWQLSERDARQLIDMSRRWISEHCPSPKEVSRA